MKLPLAAALLFCLTFSLTPAFAQDASAPPAEPSLQAESPQVEPAQSEPAPPANTGQDSARRARRRLELPPGIQPRAAAAAYPVSRQQPRFSIGAQLLSAKEVEQKLSTPLGKRYLVVEVGIFPAASQAIDLLAQDFTLREGSDNQAFFPSAPADIADEISGAHRRSAGVYPTTGVGYGPWGPSVGVGVGVYPYPRRGGMGERNTRVMETELREKSLPEGSLTQPVAGYLYFPLTRKRNAHYNLEFTRNGETVALALPDPRK